MTSLGERILDTVFEEGATFKATIQGFLRAARAVTAHPNVPKSVKKQIDSLRSTLASNKWADLSAEDAAAVSEAIRKELGEETPPETITEATKTEDGVEFTSTDYAYVPDPDMPSTWKLRLSAIPGGKPDARIVGAAVAALGEGFRGQRVEIPQDDLAAVKAKVREAWRKANPDKDADEMPPVIREAFVEDGVLVTEFIEDGALVVIG